MFRTFKKSIRMAEKYDDNALYTNLASYIEREYSDIDGVHEMVSDAANVLDLLDIVGLHITNVSNDGYNWSTVNAEIINLPKFEKLLQHNKGLFYEFSVLSLRNNQDSEVFEFEFASPEAGFKCHPIPFFQINVHPGTTVIYKDEKGYYHVNDNVRVKEDVVDLFGLCSDPWSPTCVSYYINWSNGIYKCTMDVPVYDGLEIKVYGYGDSPEAALRDVNNTYERLHEEAMDNGYQN